MTTTETSLHTNSPTVRIVPGGIYRLRDRLIHFPDSDSRKTRTVHQFRTVLVMSSAVVCQSIEYACVIAAPMSHHVHICASVDVIIQPNRENNLDRPGRVLLSYMQPVLKTDFEKQFGVMGYEDWQKIMVAVIAGLDH